MWGACFEALERARTCWNSGLSWEGATASKRCSWLSSLIGRTSGKHVLLGNSALMESLICSNETDGQADDALQSGALYRRMRRRVQGLLFYISHPNLQNSPTKGSIFSLRCLS